MAEHENPTALCGHCGRNEATVLVRRVAGGKEEEVFLCSLCAEETRAETASAKPVSDPLSLLFESMESTGSAELCEQCGTSYQRFKETGRLGCARCYEVFAEDMRTLLKRIHGSSQHRGQGPVRDGEDYLKAARVRRLNEALDRAVSAEDYEKAASLRDQILALDPASAQEQNT